MSLSDNVKNMRAIHGNRVKPATNAPKQYRDRHKQYYADATTTFVEKYAKYSSDFVKARVQGLDPEDFTKWRTVNMRLSDIVKPSAAITRHFDDYKHYLIDDPTIDYVPFGAKVSTMGNIWLVTNPANLSSVGADGIMQRCNGTWRYLDYYGNIQQEPIVIEKVSVNASTNDFQETVEMMRGYYNIIVQRNAATEQLDQNSRIFIGRRVWAIRGYSDFAQEFTGDDSSRHITYFSAQVTEPNPETDDFENQVANAYPFSWDVNITGVSQLQAGNTAQFTVSTVRNGLTVVSTEENPIDYQWLSSNVQVATVDQNGLVTAVGQGSATISATLIQNPAFSQSVALNVNGESIFATAEGNPISVTDAAEAPVVELFYDEDDILHLTYQRQSDAPTPTVDGAVTFIGTPVSSIGAYSYAEFTAAYFRNGEQTADLVDYELSGADKNAYTIGILQNVLTVYCWQGSVEPLTIKATANGVSTSIVVELVGL